MNSKKPIDADAPQIPPLEPVKIDIAAEVFEALQHERVTNGNWPED